MNITRIFALILLSLLLISCTGYSWWNTYGYDGRGNVWSKKKCSTHCRTFSEDGNTCISYHRNVQPYCDYWVDN